MIADGLSFTQLCQQVAPVLAEWRDKIVPSAVELLPNNLYTPAYAWMFSYEKRLKYRIEDVLQRPVPVATERLLFGADGVLSEALSNAFAHGHRRLPDLPITLSCNVGRQGLALRVEDRGSGFDVAQVVTGLGGSGCYSFAGNGLRALHDNESVLASYSNGGRALSLRILW
jgi:hypothetical protein